jgi:peptide/nickel transport system substrate-binding protein
MKRRIFMASSLASLALPSVVRAATATTLRFIPQIDLAFLDPHWTTANVTRGHAYMVFDTLYGQNGSFAPSPQMLEGHVVENDGKLWKLTLRSGLFWHDGQPVRLHGEHQALGGARCVRRRAHGRDRRIVGTR